MTSCELFYSARRFEVVGLKPLTVDDVVFTYEQIVFNLKFLLISKTMFGSSGSFSKSESLMNAEFEFILPEPLRLSLQTPLATRQNTLFEARSTKI